MMAAERRFGTQAKMRRRNCWNMSSECGFRWVGANSNLWAMVRKCISTVALAWNACGIRATWGQQMGYAFGRFVGVSRRFLFMMSGRTVRTSPLRSCGA